MSDEPLWCPRCGQEVGPDHADCDYDPADLDEKIDDPFCEISGARARDCEHCR